MVSKNAKKKIRAAAVGGLAAGVAALAVGGSRPKPKRQSNTTVAQARALQRVVGNRLRNDYIAGRMTREDFLRHSATNAGHTQAVIDHLSGHGGYVRDIVGGLGTGLGYLGGGVMGSAFGPSGAALGSAIGGSVGGGIGNEISNIMGAGDYVVNSNTISTSGAIVPEGQEVPTFGSGTGATRVTHREYVKDIVVPASPTTFNIQSFVLNPGNATLFPWLSSLASKYQQYEFLGCVITFKTMSSDITAGGALGTVIMATNYDVLQAPFSDKITMENTQYTVSAKPSQSQIHAVECDPAQRVTKLQYVRSINTSTSTSQDARFYGLGNFQLATQGLPGSAGVVMGELWITYDVMLHKPLVNSAGPPTQSLVANSPSVSNPMGTTTTSTGAILTTVSGLTGISFNSTGQFLVEIVMQGTGLHNASTGGTATKTNGQGPNPATTLTTNLEVFSVAVSAVGQTFTFDTTNSTTLTGFTVQVTQISTGVWVSG